MKRVYRLFFIFIFFSASWIYGTESTKNGSYLKNSENRSYRIWFDQENRIRLEWAGNFHYANNEKIHSSFDFFSFGITKSWIVKGELGDFWKKHQKISDFSISTSERNGSNLPLLSGFLFQGQYLQYQKASYLTIGSTRIPLPFHFGFSLELGGIHSLPSKNESIWDFTVIDSRLLLDFWKSKKLQNTFLFGLGVYYDIVLHKESSETDHRIAPFTALKLLFSHSSTDSLSKTTASIDWIPIFSSLQKKWGFYLKAELKLERIVIAVNDQPLSLFGKAVYRSYQLFSGQEKSSEYQFLTGLTFSYQLN